MSELIVVPIIIALITIGIILYKHYVSESKPDSSRNQEAKTDKQLVVAQLAGVEHKFYLEKRFAEELMKVLDAPSDEVMFFYEATDGSVYAINLSCIEHVHVPDDFSAIENADAEGVSVYLVGKNNPILLGDAKTREDDNSEQFKLSQFLGFDYEFGRHYFNKDEIALLVRKVTG